MTAIHLRKLVKKYGDTTAVDGIDLDINAGELFFLLGPSGCGKTTLLRMLAGFIDPTAGVVMFGDKDVTLTPPNKRNTGMVFQSYALWPHMTVAENVAYGLKIRKHTPVNQRKKALEALAKVHMEHLADRKPNELSGGQQQRVALARAIVVEPEVLLLDEPLSNLDAKLRLEMRSEIRRICTSLGITTVYVTHDQKEALSIADRMAILKDGQVQQVGTPTEIYREPISQFVAEFIGETNFVPADNGKIWLSGCIWIPSSRCHLHRKESRVFHQARSTCCNGNSEIYKCTFRYVPQHNLSWRTCPAPSRGYRWTSTASYGSESDPYQ